MFAITAFTIIYLVFVLLGVSTDFNRIMIMGCFSLLIQIDIDIYRLWKELQDD